MKRNKARSGCNEVTRDGEHIGEHRKGIEEHSQPDAHHDESGGSQTPGPGRVACFRARDHFAGRNIAHGQHVQRISIACSERLEGVTRLLRHDTHRRGACDPVRDPDITNLWRA